MVVGFFVWRVVKQRRFLAKVRELRLEPAELKEMLGRPSPPLVLDLRHRRELVEDPHTLPGALQVSPSELPSRHKEIPRDRELILFCS